MPERKHVSYDKDGRLRINAPAFSPGEWIWIAAGLLLFVAIPLVCWFRG